MLCSSSLEQKSPAIKKASKVEVNSVWFDLLFFTTKVRKFLVSTFGTNTWVSSLLFVNSLIEGERDDSNRKEGN